MCVQSWPQITGLHIQQHCNLCETHVQHEVHSGNTKCAIPTRILLTYVNLSEIHQSPGTTTQKQFMNNNDQLSSHMHHYIHSF